MTQEIKDLILQLHAIGVVQFGSFTLKHGMQTPIYIDLRLVISYPPLMKKLIRETNRLAAQLSFDLLCGIPYAALPIATALSLEGGYPMIWCRKEIKDYGTKKLIEGKYHKGQTCLLIEDVMTQGESTLEIATLLRSEGLEIHDAIVILDRSQGAKENLKKNGIVLHPLIEIFDLLDILLHETKISAEISSKVHAFLTGH